MATPISTTSDPASPPAPRSGRQQTISYADLMKPDEDWRNLPNPADRRKIQNRLAQRAYRRSLRDRNKEVKRLKKQLEMLEESQGLRQPGSPAPDQEKTGGGVSSHPGSPHQSSMGGTTPLSVAGSDVYYLHAWPSHEHDQHYSHNPSSSAFWGAGGFSHDQVLASPDLDFSSMDFDNVPDLLLSLESGSGYSTNTLAISHSSTYSNICLPPTPQYSPIGMPNNLGSLISSCSPSDPHHHHHFNMDATTTTTSIPQVYSPPSSSSPYSNACIDPMLSLSATPGSDMSSKQQHHHKTSHPKQPCCCSTNHNHLSSRSPSPIPAAAAASWRPILQRLGIADPDNNLAMSLQQQNISSNANDNAKVVAFLIQYSNQPDGSGSVTVPVPVPVTGDHHHGQGIKEE